MTNWKKRVEITFLSGVLATSAFVFPVIPSASVEAKPSTVKVMSAEHRDHSKEQFEKGTKKNLKIQTSGKDAILEPSTNGEVGVYTSPVIKSDITFTDVGIHWKNVSKTADPEIQVRYSADGKEWSDWIETHPEELFGEPTSGDEEETFSQLVYTEKSDYLQYQFQLDASKKVKIKDIKVTFLNSEDGEKVEPETSFWDFLFGDASAATNLPSNVASRADWGADESIRFVNGVESWPREYHPVDHLFVHHTDTPNGETDVPARIRSIYTYHTKTRGYGDIAYNVIIGPDGKIYEGRKGKDGEVLTKDVVGAGTYGFNYGGYSIALMGSFESTITVDDPSKSLFKGVPLPANMRQKLVEMLAYSATENNIDPTGTSDFVRDYNYDPTVVPYIDPDVQNISGHKDSKYTPGTLCPGDYVYNQLPQIRQDVKTYMQFLTPMIALTASSNSYNSIKLSWQEISGAAGYEVWRATSSTGTYTKITTTSNNSYIDTSLNTGTTYYYKVRAYKADTSTQYSGYSSVVSAKPILATPTSVKAASSSYNSIKTSWAAVSGASGYEVYRATLSTGTYSLVGTTTTSTSFTNSSLTTNTTYFYKVRAYRTVGTTKVYSGYSSVVSAKPIPSVPTNFKVTRVSSTSLKLTWSAVSGASGYEIYRSTSSSGTYSLLKSTTSLYYTNTGLTTGKTYYYKARAYRTVGTTKVYSGWTTVISAMP
jgi:fibronectin type 3 domain-containing protein